MPYGLLSYVNDNCSREEIISWTHFFNMSAWWTETVALWTRTKALPTAGWLSFSSHISANWNWSGMDISCRWGLSAIDWCLVQYCMQVIIFNLKQWHTLMESSWSLPKPLSHPVSALCFALPKKRIKKQCTTLQKCKEKLSTLQIT